MAKYGIKKGANPRVIRLPNHNTAGGTLVEMKEDWDVKPKTPRKKKYTEEDMRAAYKGGDGRNNYVNFEAWLRYYDNRSV